MMTKPGEEQAGTNQPLFLADFPHGSAHWIWTETTHPNQWVAFRKNVTVDTVPLTVPTAIAVDSKYWLWINGQLVIFEGGLKRGPTPQDTYFDALDLAPFLTPGTNSIAVLVWYFGKDGFAHKDSGAGGLLWQSPLVESDASWHVRPHPGYLQDREAMAPNDRLAESHIYYDARLAQGMRGWETLPATGDDWSPAKVLGRAGSVPWNHLSPRPIPFWRNHGLCPYASVSTTDQPDGSLMVRGHLPANIQVTPFLEVTAPAGKTIQMRTDHWLDGGEPTLQATYVTTAGQQSFESLGWLSGTTVEYTLPPGVQVHALRYRETGYATERLGHFATSDAFLQRLWDKSAHTISLNLRDTFMDCPTRERAQWWGDVVNDQLAGFYLFDEAFHALCAKAIRELIGWQRPDGTLFAPIPAGNWEQELPQQMLAAIWSLAETYRYTGAAATVAACYPAVKRYLALWEADEDGFVIHRGGDWDFPDWGDNIDTVLLDQAWYTLALASAEVLAELNGQMADVALWQQRRAHMQSRFQGRFWDPEVAAYRTPQFGGMPDDRANALAVVAGLVPPAFFAAMRTVLCDHHHASPYLELQVLRALYHMGYASDAETRMKARYAKMVAAPGDTLWELWEMHPNSTDDHGWSAGAAYLFPAWVVGVQPTAPGFTTYRIHPQLGTQTSVAAAIPTPHGIIDVAMSRQEAGGLTMTLTSPPGTQATVELGQTPHDMRINDIVVFPPTASSGNPPGCRVIQGGEAAFGVELAPGTWQIMVR